jgi:pilus assembly protein FimV
MPRHAEDISKIEDIGQRLDALLDALETTSSEVARVGADLDKPLEALLAEASASKPMPERSPPKWAPDVAAQPAAAPELPPEPVAAEADAVAQPQEEASDEPESSSASELETRPKAEPEPEPEIEPEIEAEAEPELEIGEGSQTDAIEPEPQAGVFDENTAIDDGLLIEPESYTSKPADDIDGAPVGPLNLEAELDQELESLLASGMFEDPLAEMGVDESAEPLELAEEPARSVAPAAEVRKPNLPTDEAELIGELDEQLAALADAQLADDGPAEGSPPPEAPAPAARHPAAAPAAIATPKPEPAAAPEVVTRPVAPSAPAKRGWKLHAERAWLASKPVAERMAVRAGKIAVAGATRASAPLKDKPAAKQIVGWVALVHAFYAACIWVYLTLWHNPPPPPAEAPQPTIVAPEQG